MKKKYIKYTSITLIILLIIVVIYMLFFDKKEMINDDISVLMYHNIENNPWSEHTASFVTKENFEKQLKLITEEKYETVFLKEIEKVTNKKKIVLTFDDGYKDFYDNAFPLLKKYNVKATLFMISDYTAEKYEKYLSKEQIKELSDSNLVDIGSHTKSHPRLSTLSTDKMEQELKESKEELEDITKKEVTTIAYPYGNWNAKIVNSTKKHYKYAVTTKSGTYNSSKNNYTIDRKNITRDMNIEDFKEIIRK